MIRNLVGHNASGMSSRNNGTLVKFALQVRQPGSNGEPVCGIDGRNLQAKSHRSSAKSCS